MTGVGPTLAGGTGIEGTLAGGSGVLGGGFPVPVLNNVTSITHASLNNAQEMVLMPDLNTLLVVAQDSDTISVIDITDRENPVVSTSFTNVNLDQCYSIALNSTGTVAYVGGGTNRLAIVDTANPLSMSLLGGTVDTDWSVTYRLRMLNDSHVVLPASNDGQVHILNVTNPASITTADTVTLNNARMPSVKGNRWIYCSSSAGVATFDAADPTNVLFTQSGATLGLGATFGNDFYDNENYLIVCKIGTTTAELRVMNLSATPGTPTEVATAPLNHGVTSTVAGVVVADQYAFSVWGGTTLYADDLSPISSGGAIQAVDDLTLPFQTNRSIVWHPDHYLYITSPGSDRLMVVSTS